MTLLKYLKENKILDKFMSNSFSEFIRIGITIDIFRWIDTKEGFDFWKNHFEKSFHAEFTEEDIEELKIEYPEDFV